MTRKFPVDRADACGRSPMRHRVRMMVLVSLLLVSTCQPWARNTQSPAAQNGQSADYHR